MDLLAVRTQPKHIRTPAAGKWTDKPLGAPCFLGRARRRRFPARGRDRNDKEPFNPRISIAKADEYIVASPGSRATILHDQKFPPAFKANRFRDAYVALSEILVDGGVHSLDGRIAEWRSASATAATTSCLSGGSPWCGLERAPIERDRELNLVSIRLNRNL